MTLPDNFSPWEHLQSVLLRAHNPLVREEFRDVGGDDWDPDITVPRGSLRVACTLRDDDSALMTLIRLHLFYYTLRKASDLQAPIYGIPVAGFQEARKFRPQIQLHFQEDAQDVEQGYAPVTGEISFRLMRDDAESLSMAEVRNYAQKVRTNFATGNGFVWQKGRVMASYEDRERGYGLRLLVRSKAEARRVIEQVLDIQGHAPNWERLNISESEDPAGRFPIVPGTDMILGQSRRRPRQRPIASVRFQAAYLHIHGMPNAVVLIDLTGRRRNPILRAV